VAAGLGTIARLVSSGAEIYKEKLSFAEAEDRINRLYRPYHATLSDLIDKTMQQFGVCLLVDCHSMPSFGGPAETDAGQTRFDVILGDCYGAACASTAVAAVETFLRGKGYAVGRNLPYAGGYTTRHYGRPTLGQHALQIEINRRIYMDEATHQKTPAFGRVQSDLDELIVALTQLPTTLLSP
jgi:N-formylglutamate amidohydrolase